LLNCGRFIGPPPGIFWVVVIHGKNLMTSVFGGSTLEISKKGELDSSFSIWGDGGTGAIGRGAGTPEGPKNK